MRYCNLCTKQVCVHRVICEYTSPRQIASPLIVLSHSSNCDSDNDAAET